MTVHWKQKAVSPADVVGLIPSNSNVFLHGAAATPTPLAEALAARTNIEGVKIYHLHTVGDAPFAAADCLNRFRSISFFCGAPLRKPVEDGCADFIPIFLSDIPGLFHSGQIPLKAAILQLSPPDRHGMCTLGTSVDAARAAADHSQIILAEINEQMPRTHGNTVVPFEKITAFTATNRPLHTHAAENETPEIGKIGEFVAELIEDRSTLQMGIGAIPDAALSRILHKRDLAIHTEMFSDRVVDLVQAGAVTNKFKSIHPGRIVTSFVSGTQKLFDFVNDNPLVEFHPCDRTNDTSIIRKNDKVVAVNSALQIDLSGQVCADSIGHKIYSGIGGQMDFIRGAALSKGGKPVIALPSTAGKGKYSRIVMSLNPGAGVVTTRGHIHWVVTEYGAVNLHGKTLRERGELLISIAHPDFRATLKNELNELRHFALC